MSAKIQCMFLLSLSYFTCYAPIDDLCANIHSANSTHSPFEYASMYPGVHYIPTYPINESTSSSTSVAQLSTQPTANTQSSSSTCAASSPSLDSAPILAVFSLTRCQSVYSEPTQQEFHLSSKAQALRRTKSLLSHLQLLVEEKPNENRTIKQ